MYEKFGQLPAPLGIRHPADRQQAEGRRAEDLRRAAEICQPRGRRRSGRKISRRSRMPSRQRWPARCRRRMRSIRQPRRSRPSKSDISGQAGRACAPPVQQWRLRHPTIPPGGRGAVFRASARQPVPGLRGIRREAFSASMARFRHRLSPCTRTFLFFVLAGLPLV